MRFWGTYWLRSATSLALSMGLRSIRPSGACASAKEEIARIKKERTCILKVLSTGSKERSKEKRVAFSVDRKNEVEEFLEKSWME